MDESVETTPRLVPRRGKVLPLRLVHGEVEAAVITAPPLPAGDTAGNGRVRAVAVRAPGAGLVGRFALSGIAPLLVDLRHFSRSLPDADRPRFIDGTVLPADATKPAVPDAAFPQGHRERSCAGGIGITTIRDIEERRSAAGTNNIATTPHSRQWRNP